MTGGGLDPSYGLAMQLQLHVQLSHGVSRSPALHAAPGICFFDALCVMQVAEGKPS